MFTKKWFTSLLSIFVLLFTLTPYTHALEAEVYGPQIPFEEIEGFEHDIDFPPEIKSEFKSFIFDLYDNECSEDLAEIKSNLEKMNDDEMTNYWDGIDRNSFVCGEMVGHDDLKLATNAVNFADASNVNIKILDQKIKPVEISIKKSATVTKIPLMHISPATSVNKSLVVDTPIIEYYDGIEENMMDLSMYYLSKNQNDDGSFGELSQLEISSEVAYILNSSNKTANDQYAALLAYFDTVTPQNNREKAILDYISVSLGQSNEYLDGLLAMKNSNGGYPLLPGYKSDVITTLEVVRSFWKSNFSLSEGIPQGLYYVLSQISADGSMRYFADAEPNYYLMNKTLEYLYLFKDMSIGDGGNNISVQSKIDLILGYLASHVDELTGTLTDSESVIDNTMTLRSFDLYNEYESKRAAMFKEWQNAQNYNGSFGKTFYTSAAAMKSFSRPEMQMVSLVSTGDLQNRMNNTFELTIKNEGYETFSQGNLNLFIDNYHYRTYDLGAAGVTINPGQEAILQLDLTDILTLVDTMEIKFQIEFSEDPIQENNWIAENFTFATAPDNKAAQPLFQIASAYQTAVPGIYLQWHKKTDINRTGYAVAVKKTDTSDWEALAIDANAESQYLYNSNWQNGDSYDVVIGVMDNVNPGQITLSFDNVMSVVVSTQPQDQAGSLSGNVTLLGESFPDINITSDANGSNTIESASDESGDFNLTSVYNGFRLLSVNHAAYEPLMEKVTMLASGTTSGIHLYTRLKPDSTSPIISQFEIVNQTSQIVNNQEVELSITASDNIALKEADFYYWDPNDAGWNYLGTNSLEGITESSYFWYIPEGLAGAGYKTKVVVWDFQGNSVTSSEISFELVQGYNVSGTISKNGFPKEDVIVNAKVGSEVRGTATTDVTGLFSIYLPNGSYTVIPDGSAGTFIPTSHNVSVSGADEEGIDFDVDKSLEHYNSLDSGVGGALLEFPVYITIKDDLAYVTVNDTRSLEIINIADPSNPQHVGSISSGEDGAVIVAPKDVVVDGDYAYIASSGDSSIVIIDISDPSNPSYVSKFGFGDPDILFENAYTLAVKNGYAYIAGRGGWNFDIIDVSNPASPQFVTTLLHGENGATLKSPSGVKIQGDYMYVATSISDTLEVFNISDPANPVHTGSVYDDVLLNGAYHLDVKGSYAYVAAHHNDSMAIIDISNPASPNIVASIANGDQGVQLDGIRSVFASGDYVYTASYDSHAMSLIDVSNPASPVHVGTIVDGQDGAKAKYISDVFVYKGYAYIPALSNKALEIIDATSYAPQEADINASPTNLDFGDTSGGSTSEETITVQNSGNSALSIGAISLSNNDASAYAIGTDNCSNQSINPMNECTINIQFTPPEVLSYQAELHIPSNDSDTSDLTINLQGNGVEGNTPPTITLIQPDTSTNLASSEFTITWTDEDPEEDAVINLYYDTDGTGADGTLITTTPLSEDDVADEYLWNVSQIPEGDYYIYAIIDDGVNEPVTVYSEGIVTVKITIISFAFDEIAGSSTFQDLSGYENNATCTGDACPTAGVTGKVGNALLFDGEDDDVTVPNALEFAPEEEITMMTWIKPGASSSSTPYMYVMGRGSDVELLIGKNGMLRAGVKNANNERVHFETPNALNMNNWNHIAMTYDGTTIKSYINGELIESASQTGNIRKVSGMTIGNVYSAYPFGGLLDEAKVLSRALTDAELLAVYEEDPVGNDIHFKFEEAEGSESFANDKPAIIPASCTGGSCPTAGVTGKVGSALLFDGEDDDVTVPNALEFAPEEEITMMTWIKPGSSTSSTMYVMGRGSDVELTIGKNGMLRAGVKNANNERVHFETPNALNMNNWNHIAMTYDGAIVKSYVNGEMMGSASQTGNIRKVSGMTIGNVYSAYPFGGLLDEARVLSRALTDAELLAVYEEDPISNDIHFKFEEAEGSESFINDKPAIIPATCTGGSCPTAEVIGLVGNALSFGEGGDILNVPNGLEFAPEEEITMMAWIKPETTSIFPTTYMYIMGRESDAELLIGKNGMLRAGIVNENDERVFFETPNILNMNNWNHIAMTYDGATVKSFVNGELVESQAQTGKIRTDRQMTIGNMYSVYAYHGLLDEAKVLGRAMTDAEILAVYEENPVNDDIHFRFEEAEGSTSFENSELATIPATCTGDACPTAGVVGRVGNALSFDGEDDDVTVPNALELAPEEEITMMAWIKPGTESALSLMYVMGRGSDVELTIGKNGMLRAGVKNTNNERVHFETQNAVSMNNWNHIAMTYDGATVKSFVNGELVESASQTGNIKLASSMTIGNVYSSYLFSGLIDEVKVLGRAMTDAEILEVYEEAP